MHHILPNKIRRHLRLLKIWSALKNHKNGNIISEQDFKLKQVKILTILNINFDAMTTFEQEQCNRLWRFL